LCRLAAFRYRDGRVVECLDEHLRDVAVYTYPLVASKELHIVFAALASSLLHDVGKALNVYQDCTIYRDDGACSYVGHEVFSALITLKALREDSIPDAVAISLAKALGCNEAEARGIAVKLIVQAVLYHHQAMGSSRDRLEALMGKVGEAVGRGAYRLAVDDSLVDVVERALEEARNRLKVDYLDFHLDLGGESRENIEKIANTMNPDKILGELREARLPLNTHYAGKLLLLSRFITGCVIASDIYVAEARRGGAQTLTVRASLASHLGRLYSYSKQLRIAEHPNNTTQHTSTATHPT